MKSKKISLFSFDIITFKQFFAIEFLKPDIPNHATSAEFSIFIDDGYLVKDFKIRADKGKNFEYNISNSVSEIKNAWSKGVQLLI